MFNKIKNKLFSKKNKTRTIQYKIFGINIEIPNKQYWDNLDKENEKQIAIQNAYDMDIFKNAKKLIIFFTPFGIKINGGVMSIYSLCETSRKLNPNSVCVILTTPNKYTYANNDTFLNNEKIYRLSQIVDNCNNLEELIVHIPEYQARKFYSLLSRKEKNFFKSVKNLQINIMNQNINLMPERKEFKSLYKLTNNITQTMAHDRYATQENCNKWQIPTHLFSVMVDITKYQRYSFEQKEKIIAISPDSHSYKEEIIEALKKDFPDWEFVVIRNMPFMKYIDLVSRAYFTLTFGEGMDFYFIQSNQMGSVGFAVYNDEFFPDENWKNLENVFLTYDNMKEDISKKIKELYQNKDLYLEVSANADKKIKEIYNPNEYVDNLKRFYEKKYDFYPQK